MRDIFFFFIIALSAYGIGSNIVRLFMKEAQNHLENFVFSTGLGLALFGYIVYIIGSFGFLYQRYIVIALFVCALTALYPAYKLFRGFKYLNIARQLINLSIFEKFLTGVLVLIPVMCLLGAMAPEIGNDTLAYHLYHPKVFIENHKIGYIPFTRESLWPYLAEMLFTIGCIFKSVSIAKLFHYFFGILSTLAVFSFTRRYFSKKEALLAATLFISAPGIFMQMTYSYIDLAQCFYSFMAFYALMVWQEKKNTRFIVLCAMLLGCALSVKLMSGFLFVIFSMILCVHFVRERSNLKTAFGSFFILGILSFLVCCVWYVRSYVVLGNPVYPFLHNVFGSGWETNITKGVGLRKDFIGFLRLPWDLVLNFESFGGEQVGVISLAFLPCILFSPFKKRITQYLLIFLLTFAGLWFAIDPQMRFSFVNFAILYILIAIGFSAALRKYNFWFPKVLLAVCILFNSALCLYHNRDAIKLALGKTTHDKYLFEKERTFPVAEFVNKNTPLNSILIVVGEPRLYYFDRSVIKYDIYKIEAKKDIFTYIKELKDSGKPVYLLYVDNSEYDVFRPLLNGKQPVFAIKREQNEHEFATYYLYNL
jgi:hypothetical protein